MNDLFKANIAFALSVLALLLLPACAGAAEPLDDVRAQKYLRAVLARGHTNHSPEFFVRDREFTNAVAELGCRIGEVKPGTVIETWYRLDHPEECRSRGCRAATPPLPGGEVAERWAQIPARNEALVRTNEFGSLRHTAPNGSLFITMRTGFWSGMTIVTIPSAARLREIFP